MKLVSFTVTNDIERYGILTEHGVIELGPRLGTQCPTLAAALAHHTPAQLAEYAQAPVDHALDAIHYLPVIPHPNKILCIGMNYAQKRKEFDAEGDAPTLFIRFPDSQAAHDTPIIKPRCTEEFDYEGELAIIIGKAGRYIAPEDALSHVAGYSPYMDGSVRDWQHQWYTAGKNWPRTGGFGPSLVTRDEVPDPQALTISTQINGECLQHDSTAHMIHHVPALIAYVSSFTALSPGDVILTGSPGGVGKSFTPPRYLQPGDVVEVEISGLGVLRNTIVDETGVTP